MPWVGEKPPLWGVVQRRQRDVGAVDGGVGGRRRAMLCCRKRIVGELRRSQVLSASHCEQSVSSRRGVAGGEVLRAFLGGGEVGHDGEEGFPGVGRGGGL